MPHDHFVMVPMTSQGAYTDVNIGQCLSAAMTNPFAFTDVFLYSHGWWTTAEDAMNDYSRFGIGLAGVMLSTAAGAELSALGIGIHWPAVISENSSTMANIFEPLSFFNRAMMADDVGQEGGYATLRLLLQARYDAGLPAPRLRLMGHSFGCKVVCAALQQMAKESVDLLAGVSIDVVLLEAAFDNDGLDVGNSYEDVPSIPNIRLLISHSDEDTALKDAYVAAGALKLFSPPHQALGYAGPTDALQARLGGVQAVSVDVGFTTAPGVASARLVVADLTPLHTHDNYKVAPLTGDLSGHHSDIFQPEIYRLIAQFLS
jgi:hypothetical protein